MSIGLEVQDILEVTLGFLDLQSPAQLHTLGSVSTLWRNASQAAAGAQGRALLPMRRLRQSIDALAGNGNPADLSPQFLAEMETLEKIFSGVRHLKKADARNKVLREYFDTFASSASIPASFSGLNSPQQRTAVSTVSSFIQILECSETVVESDRYNIGRFKLGDSLQFLLMTHSNPFDCAMYKATLGFKVHKSDDRLLSLFDTSASVLFGSFGFAAWKGARRLSEESDRGQELRFCEDRMKDVRVALAETKAATQSNVRLLEAVNVLEDMTLVQMIRIVCRVLRLFKPEGCEGELMVPSELRKELEEATAVHRYKLLLQ